MQIGTGTQPYLPPVPTSLDIMERAEPRPEPQTAASTATGSARVEAPNDAELARAAATGYAASLLASPTLVVPSTGSPSEVQAETDPPPSSSRRLERQEEESATLDEEAQRQAPREREAITRRTEVEPARLREALDAYRVAAFGNQTEAAAATPRPDIRDLTV